MKKKIFIIIGVMSATAIVSYVACKYFQDKKTIHESASKAKCPFNSKQKGSNALENYISPTESIDVTKKDTISSIKYNHCVAIKIVEESIDTIFNADNNIKTENCELLDKMSNDLSNLLK